jgi:hypothetical protein
MATRFDLSPLSAQFPTTNYPALMPNNNRMVLAYDATAQETAYWETVAPQGISGAWSAILTYRMASAASGGIAFEIAVEAVTSGDAVDFDVSNSFDTVNTGTDATVPGTAGYMKQFTITLTNMDSIAAGDRLRISVARAVANAADTATGDCNLVGVEIRDSA